MEANRDDLCASIQRTIISILLEKLEKAASDLNINHIAIAGGVSANSLLRSELLHREKTLGWKTYIPSFEFCTDNGAMIAITGYYRYQEGNFADMSIKAEARKFIVE